MTDDDQLMETEPSELDEMTHREAGLIYNDSTRTILFARGIQWKAVASTLLIYLVMIGMVKYVSQADDYVKILKIALIVTAMTAIFLLIAFQYWQHTESQKIIAIEAAYSNVFRAVRNKKSLLEANVLRYIILAVMILTVVVGGYIAIVTLDQLVPAKISMLASALC